MKAEVTALAKRLGLVELDALELWSERAAVREYEGGQTRVAAELGAFGDVERKYADIRSPDYSAQCVSSQRSGQ